VGPGERDKGSSVHKRFIENGPVRHRGDPQDGFGEVERRIRVRDVQAGFVTLEDVRHLGDAREFEQPQQLDEPNDLHLAQ